MVDEVKLTGSQLRAMADSADDVAEDVNAAGTALSDGENPDLAGFKTLHALTDVANRWQDDKVAKSAGAWTTHGQNLRETADNVNGTDQANEWHVHQAGN